MNIATSIKNKPSTFALLIDKISEMNESEQKLLWMKLNRTKNMAIAKELDDSVNLHTLSDTTLDSLIDEAKKNARKKKS